MFKGINIMRIASRQTFSFMRYCSTSSKHIVQMRGLDHDATEEDIVGFFKPLGISPTKVHLRCDGSGRTAGFSEVEFGSHKEALVALRKKNAFIGNRFIRLTLKSSDTESEAIKSSETQNTYPATAETEIEKKMAEPSPRVGHCVRMSNAPWRITDQDIFEFFIHVGARPISIHAVYNEIGKKTGHFDVMFQSSEDVQKAVAKNNAYLRNKHVHLSRKES